MLSSNNQVPPIFVRVNTRKVPTTEVHNLQSQLLREERTHSEKRPLRVSLQLKESPNLESGSLFGQGYYTIQDEAAQLIGYLVDPKEGEVIADACCGPGGKLSHLYELGDEKITLIGVETKGSQFRKAQNDGSPWGILRSNGQNKTS